MDSDNRADEFVWIHDREGTGTLYDAVPMRLAAGFGDYYDRALYIRNPLPSGTPQV